MPPLSAQEVIDLLGLKPHPLEGGYFYETYRCTDSLAAASLPARYRSAKHVSTAIYYLLTPETCSAMHRLQTDEVFHHYLGGPVTMLQLGPEGGKIVKLGSDLRAGERPQVVLPRGVWQGSYLESGAFALLGTTMAPGFDSSDYEHGDRDKLLAEFPEFAEMIRRLTGERPASGGRKSPGDESWDADA
jgi:predicted cupin superfamily sugar epimerase